MSAKRMIITLCVGAGALLTPLYSNAAMQGECAREELMSYFPARFVTKTLEKHQVPQGQRSAILKELADKDKEVVPTVEEKAARMNPNPLRDPRMRQEAVTIFRETLYDLFAATMQAHGINDKGQIQEMLDEIQQEKAKQFAFCMDQMTPEMLEEEYSPRMNGRNNNMNQSDENVDYDRYNGSERY